MSEKSLDNNERLHSEEQERKSSKNHKRGTGQLKCDRVNPEIF
jgi:hypothetical protein